MKIVDLVKEYLSSEGIRYEIDAKGNLWFKYEGFGFVLRNDESDSSYIHLVMPFVYQVKDDCEKVLEAANAVSRDTKAVKTVLAQDRLFLSVEMLVGNHPRVGDFFIRCVDALCEGYVRFYREIKS